MDKQTLSNYGWIVIAVLVLAVMIALATPFGKYIENGVRSTAEGLFNTSDKAMNAVNISSGNGSFGGDSGVGSGTSSKPKTKLDTVTEKLFNIYVTGFDVWTDGTYTYLSSVDAYSNKQYVLKDGVWETKTWDGFTKVDGSYIWTDGTNTYYSSSANHYRLNGDTWEPKTWNGGPKNSSNQTTFSGGDIWSDGSDIYLTYYNSSSKSYSHYVLDGDTWKSKYWSGFSNFSANDIWADDTYTYISSGYDQYVLKDGKWEEKNWKHMVKFDAQYIWTDGTNIYYSYSYDQHYLNGDVWESQVWNGREYFSGEDVWTDGTNFYASNGTNTQIQIS